MENATLIISKHRLSSKFAGRILDESAKFSEI